jgi:hypothetical protein
MRHGKSLATLGSDHRTSGVHCVALVLNLTIPQLFVDLESFMVAACRGATKISPARDFRVQ